jgi:two-component system CheB/CheR fusion protein
VGREAGIEWRVLVLAASGADAGVLESLLERDAIASRVCADAAVLSGEIRGGAGAAIVASEELERDLPVVVEALAAQPEWSDLPLILLTLPGRDAAPVVARLWQEAKARVSVLERPLRSAHVIAAVHAALQSRDRQYQVRDELARRRRAERALRESEARFRVMADELPIIVWLQDAEGRQEFVNRTFCEFFGVVREEMRGDRWQGLVHPDDEVSYTQEFFDCVREHRPFHGEGRVRRADGEWRWIESWGRPRLGPEGDCLGYVGGSADVTDRRRLRDALLEKTAALEEADRRKDLFLATLGHELRNPLAALDLAVRVLAEGGGDTERLHRSMRAQIEQLGSLVDDLLEVSRVAQGKIELRKAPTDLVEVVRLAAATIETDLRERKQELALSIPASLWVEGDATRLEQILANLLSNASKYTPDHGRIEVIGEREGDRAVIAVRDSGQGLARDQLERIFDPFVQDDPLGGGLGIGLTLVKGLVELHGGDVAAASEGPGRGSVFTVRLPVGEIGRKPATRRRRPVRRLPQPLRVLVVDDNRDFADSLALLLDRMGAETCRAYSGADGLEKAHNWHPQAMLVDIGLPDMTGYELAERIRSVEGGEEPLLLAVTGFSQGEAEERARAAGFDGRLVKPIDLERLGGMLRKRAARKQEPRRGAGS